ncbi:hypothetical protein [Aeromicrobium chenweiae]|uniref:Uncharacterized protein n=1 Tax=Aeromicrobium chenweiae TaxID=2079793 RepID=A0A2S0WQ46_9ACTN|nr:hypothetical protein [Aeromicrobium chenweiae]AWB93475.1 hypothetical protein C3E78_15345 [Aeromicrobium chenweiae]TGN34468.1 hypothetical protein E4L97_05360 [Aeromicrobium chenweiae]
MTYTADKPPLARSRDELRAQIPGWGVDLDPADRPAFPQERRDLDSGAHWDFPERQEVHGFRERSIEHGMMPPVFGTSVPLKGLSGVIRRYAYARFSEARAAHWLLLLGADRVDAVESHLRSLLTAHPDNPVTETGIRAELTHHGLASRRAGRRVDTRHQWMDPILVAGPWLVTGTVAVRAVRRLARRRTGTGGPA